MRLIYIIPFLFLLISCGNKTVDETAKGQLSPVSIDSIAASSQKIIIEDAGEQYYFPRCSPDGSKIIVTGSNYKGIWSFNIKDQKLLKLTDEDKSGYEYVSSKNGNTIFFIGAKFIDDIRRYDYSLQAAEAETGKKETLFSSRNRMSNLKLIDDNTLSFFFADSLVFFSTSFKKFIAQPLSDFKIIKVYGNKLFVYTRNGQKEMTPFGEDNIISVDESPVKNEFLLYVAGKGMYKYFSEADDFRFLGDFQNAAYSPNGKMIAYTIEENDGHHITGSEIFIALLEKTKSFRLTNTKDVHEMNPAWSPNGESIIFNTEDGKIKEIKLIITEQEKDE